MIEVNVEVPVTEGHQRYWEAVARRVPVALVTSQAILTATRYRQHGSTRYAPAERLFRVGRLLAGTRVGMKVDEMAEQSGVGRRTAEQLRGNARTKRQLPVRAGFLRMPTSCPTLFARRLCGSRSPRYSSPAASTETATGPLPPSACPAGATGCCARRSPPSPVTGFPC